jgi:hypothetical protein
MWQALTMEEKMILNRRACVGLIVCALVLPVHAQQPVIAAAPSEARQFDSLLGTWTMIVELHKPNIPPKLDGKWTFTRDGDGFMIIDEYRVFNSEGKTAYLGNTYRVYDPLTRAWTYQFTEAGRGPFSNPSRATWSSGTSRAQGNELIDEATQEGRTNRARFYNIGSDHFSCEFEVSRDGGATWTSNGHVEAHKAAAAK